MKSMRLASLIPLLVTLAPGVDARAQASGRPAPRFEISFTKQAHAEPITGRVYVAHQPHERRAQHADPADRRDRRAALRRERRRRSPPGEAAIDRRARRSAIRCRACATFPRGEYWVQPFVNVYTKFARADGHTVWLHMDQWEGQNWKRSPGNLYGEPVKITLRSGSRRRRSSSSPTRSSRRSRARRQRVREAHQDPERRSSRSGGDIRSTSARRCCCRRTTTSIPT